MSKHGTLLPFDKELEEEEEDFNETLEDIFSPTASSTKSRSSSDFQETKPWFQVNMLPTKEIERYKKRKGAATMRGQMYEVKMCAFLFLKLINLKAEFYLCSNSEECGDFDDVVVSYRYKTINGELEDETLFIQLKHAEKKEATRSVSFFDGYFDLNRYFLCFCKLYNIVDPKHKILCSNPYDRKYLIFTNANVKRQDLCGKWILTETNEYSQVLKSILSRGVVYKIQESETTEYQECINILTRLTFSDSHSDSEYMNRLVMKNIDEGKIENNCVLQKLVGKLKLKNTDIIKTVKEHPCFSIDSFKYFISLLRICCNQVDEHDIDKHIREEIEKSISHATEETEVIRNKLLEGIKYWWENESHYLTENYALWTDIIRDIESSRFRQREDELKKLGVRFSKNALMETQLKVEQNYGLFNIVCSGSSTTLTSLKLLQIFTKRKSRNYLLISFKTLVEKSDLIFSTWSGRWCQILVVEIISCYKLTEDLIKRICESILTEPKVKVIFITSHQDTMLKHFLKHRVPCKSISDTILVSDLDEGTQKKLFNKKIIFQGQLIKLNAILDMAHFKIVNSDVLEYIVANEHVFLGRDIEEYKIDNYVSRWIEIPTLDESIFHSNYTKVVLAVELEEDNEHEDMCQYESINVNNTAHQDLSFVVGMTCTTLQSGNEKENFETLCEQFENVYWLKKIGDKYIWKKGKGDISIVKKFLKSSESHVGVDENIFVRDDIQYPVLITGDPGMGKSTLLCQMAVMLKYKYKSKWVILVQLSRHCEYLSKMNDIQGQNVHHILENSLSLNNNESYIFNLEASNNLNNCIVLLDAFDEIGPIYTEKVRDIIKYLIDASCLVYITSRPSYVSYLEQEFCTLSYRIAPLSNDLKEQYLVNILKVVNPEISLQKIFEKLPNILAQFSSLCDEENNFTENPLQLKMLAETFCDLIQNAGNRSEYIFNIYQIYSLYVRKKCEIFFTDKKKADIFNPNTKLELEAFILNFIEANKIISAGIYKLNTTGEAYSIKLSRDLIANKCLLMEKDLLQIGILSYFSDTYAHYIHKSFAEYFYALSISSDYEKKSNVKIIKETLFRKDYTVVKHFFDLKCAEKCKLHTLIILSEILDSQELISSDDVESMDVIGRQTIHIAALYNRSETLKVLIKNYDDLLVEDNIGWTPVDYVIVSNNWESLDVIVGKMFELQKCGGGFLKTVTLLIKLKRIKMKIWSYIKVMKDNIVYICCLKALNNLLTIAQENVNLNKALDIKHLTHDSFLYTKYNRYSRKVFPLHVAVYSKNIDIIKQLIDYKCDPNVQTVPLPFAHSYTALQMASEEGHGDIVKVLVELGCDINCINNVKRTALHYACKNGHLGVVKTLIQSGCDVNKKDRYLQTPLHLACQNRNFDIVKILVEVCDDINAKNRFEKTSLHLAAEHGNVDIVKVLIENNSDVNITDINIETPLYIACENGHVNIAEILIKGGSNVNCINFKGDTVLHSACRIGNTDVVKLLLENGSKVNSENVTLETALYLATMNDHKDVVNLLQENL